MFKAGIDQDAIVQMFSQASIQQGEALRKAVSDATLKALQGRELTLANIRKVLETVTQAASMGAAQNNLPAVDMGDLLGKAFSGMDAALLQAVQAHRKALQQFVDQGISLRETHMKAALANIEKMEDVFFATVGKAAQQATGAQATSSVEQLMSQAQAALRDGRAAGLRSAQAMMESYATLVSGVLIGMSEGLQPGATEAKSRKN